MRATRHCAPPSSPSTAERSRCCVVRASDVGRERACCWSTSPHSWSARAHPWGQVIERRAVEGVVAKFAQDEIVSLRPEILDDLPAAAALAGVLGPDPPLRVTIAVGVLAVADAHPV